MTRSRDTQAEPVVDVINGQGSAELVLVCEHASRRIPPDLNDLGLAGDVLTSHAAWDIGAGAVAQAMSENLDAPLVVSLVSRLVYDCNRPPDAPDVMPERSEVFEIPGNQGLSDDQRHARMLMYYQPFDMQLEQTLAAKSDPALVTIHSFTPVYHGIERAVEIGILHDEDSRLADAMIASAADHCQLSVRRNEPYDPQDGVTHTLKRHGLHEKRLNVMIEVRNDLIATATAQAAMAQVLSSWLSDALTRVKSAA